MKRENTYDSITEVLSNLPENYKIMEESIDLEVQKAYYELTKSLKVDPETDLIPELIQELNESTTETEELKKVLLKLAMIDSVEAYRAIEQFNQNPQPELKEWAILSLQQSRMVLQSSLLGEQQVYISTGLGGKENKLRYFLIFPYNKVVTLNITQSESLHSEIKFFMNQCEGIVEEIEFFSLYATATVLLPLTTDIPALIKSILQECNQFGNFLSEDVLITNMKKFEHKEIKEILEQYERK